MVQSQRLRSSSGATSMRGLSEDPIRMKGRDLTAASAKGSMGMTENREGPRTWTDMIRLYCIGHVDVASRQVIRLFPTAYYLDRQLEYEYGKSSRSSYRFRSPVAGVYITLLSITVWVLYSTLVRKGRLVITDERFMDAFDGILAFSVTCAVVLTFSHWVPFLAKRPEAAFYIFSFPLYCLWIIWCIAVYADGQVRRDQLLHIISVTTAIQFKFWTDTTTLVLLFINLVLCDQLMNTRLLQIVIVLGLVTQAYLGKLNTEIIERVAWLKVRLDMNRLKSLREAQRQRKAGKGETIAEQLIFTLKKVAVDELAMVHDFQAQTALEAAAFETNHQGDPALLEQEELVRQCLEIVMDTDDIFAIGTVGDEGALEEEGESKFINIFQGTKRRKSNVAAKQVKRKTFEDWSVLPTDQPDYFTNLTMPKYIKNQELVGKVGIKSNLKLLDYYEPNNFILVDVGLVLLDDLIDFLNVKTSVVQKYLYQIQRRYFPNPYHNACHGAMVAHMVVLITKLLDFEQRMSDSEKTCIILAALGHDVGHPGRNNNFLISSGSLLTRLYNDISVLESFHSFLLFRFAQIGHEVNIFQNIDPEVFRGMRSSIIDLVMVTDMAQHFSSLSKVRVRRASQKMDVHGNPEDFHIVIRLCMKLADLSHGLVDWPSHLNWSLRVTQEFYAQGAHEVSLGLPMSALCDAAQHADFAKSQAGFLQFVIVPLANELAEEDVSGVFSGELVAKLLFNKHKWEMIKEKQDIIPIPAEILALPAAPPNYADTLALLAMKAKTVGDINQDPTAALDITSLINRAVPQALNNNAIAQKARPSKRIKSPEADLGFDESEFSAEKSSEESDENATEQDEESDTKRSETKDVDIMGTVVPSVGEVRDTAYTDDKSRPVPTVASPVKQDI